MLKISRDLLLKLTNPNQERNIYVHKNPLARGIFWQRLLGITLLINQYENEQNTCLDFGGGSGVFLPTLAKIFKKVVVVDLDIDDAKNIVDYFKLTNVEVFKLDITKKYLDTKFDSIVAADVLEHFDDLNLPINFIKNHLKNKGRLYTSLPTENFLYELGRKIVNKKKPLDHYHTSKYVVSKLQDSGFVILKNNYRPVYLFPVPLFQITLFEKI